VVDPNKTVAFQGERGAYSEEAILSFLGPNVDVIPCRSLTQVFEVVESRHVDLGLVPVENSLEGSVPQTYDLLFSTSLKVSGEFNLRIRHCLIANKGVELKNVRRVYSHPQALGQSHSYLESLNAQQIPYFDTAGSVKMLKDEGLKDAAAVASIRAAEIYDMDVLAKSIEDSPNNYTRFLTLSYNDSPSTGQNKTSIILSTKHIPGALCKALSEFAVRGINLAMIVSRPTKKTPWEYNFYIDCEGHISENKIKECLKALEDKTTFVKVLGSYRRSS
jgi:prephenate dehydratase